MRKLTMLRVGNTHNKPLQEITLQSAVFVGETRQHEIYHDSKVFPANHLTNVLKLNDTEKYATQYDSKNPNYKTQETQASPDLVILIRSSGIYNAVTDTHRANVMPQATTHLAVSTTLTTPAGHVSQRPRSRRNRETVNMERLTADSTIDKILHISHKFCRQKISVILRN